MCALNSNVPASSSSPLLPLQDLKGYEGTVFAEVECRANGALCQEHGAGRGGWPTIKYFNVRIITL